MTQNQNTDLKTISNNFCTVFYKVVLKNSIKKTITKIFF